MRRTKSVPPAAGEVHLQYVDLYGPTRGHVVCATDPWMAGATPQGPAAPYHPYRAEQDAAAKAVIAALEESGRVSP